MIHRSFFFIFLFLLFFTSQRIFAAVSITKPSLAISTCSVYPTNYHALGDIVIYEPNGGAKANFSMGSNITLILSAPANFQFLADAGTVSYTSEKDITAASIVVTAATITITYTVATTSNVDAMTISGIYMKATAVTGAVNITRTGGTGVINGLVNGNTVTNGLTSTNTGTLTTGITVADIANPVCNNTTTMLSLSGSTDVSSYQWQISDDNITFSDIAGATSYTYEYTPSAISSKYFRCQLTCGSTGYSASKQVTSDECTCASGDCDAVEIAVDLSMASDTIWYWDSDINRSGYCCSSPSGHECIKFVISISPQSEEVSFDVTNPGPSGGAFYRINCGPNHSLGEKVCVNGETSFCITFCKNGNDKPKYWIKAGRKTSISDDITLHPSCVGSLHAMGFVNVNWVSVFPAPDGAYNSYLSSTTLADIAITAPDPIPGGISYIDYQVSGTATGCASGTTYDTVRVNFLPATLGVTIDPAEPAICFGGAPVTLNAIESGGDPPVTYLWSTGATTGSISAGAAGDYSVTIADATDCMTANAVVTVVEFTADISANANGPYTVCSSNPSVSLNGVVTGVSTGTWTGGTGVFTPNRNTLNASYTPSAAEISAGTVSLTLTTTGNLTCPSASDIAVITINPTPSVTATPASESICSGQSSGISLTANLVGTSFAWTIAQSAEITGASDGSGASIAQTLSNAGTANGTATYTVTPSKNGCDGTPLDVVVTVKPLPAATSTPATQTICSGEATSFDLTSDVAATTFAWTVVQTGVTGASASSGATIAQTLSNAGTTAGTATFTITPTANSCAGSSITATATVNPLPSVTATPASETVCSGSATNISLSSGVAGTTFAWTISQDAGITGASASTGATIAQTLSNSGTSAGNATYTVTGTASGCSGSSTDVVITVNPTPNVATAPASQTICSGASSNIALSSNVAGTSFSWTVIQTAGITGGSASTGATIAQTLSNSTTSAGTATYTVTPSAGSCNGASADVVITINPIPAITGTTPGSRCGTGTVTLGATANIGTVYWYAASSGGASLGAGNSYTTPSIASTTSYYVDATLNGCTTASRTEVVATINAIPTITGTTPNSRCGTGTVVLEATASAGTINWYAVASGGSSLGTGTSFTTPSISSTTIYYVDATQGSCTSASRTAVTATIKPIPSITATTPESNCGTGTVTLGATASAGTINWYAASSGGASLGTGNSYTTPSISSTTTYYVDATNDGCTTASRTAIIATINAIPSIASTTPGSTCGTGTVTLGATASAGTVNWYTASSGGSSIATGNSYTTPSIASTTTYYVDATNTGCTTTSRTAVIATVYTVPSITATIPDSRCGAGTVNLGATASAGTINWYAASSGGVSLGTGISFTTPSIAATTTYYVDATENSCTTASRTSVTATIFTVPVATATPASQTICSGGSTNVSLTSSVPSSTFTWTVAQGADISGASNGSGASITQNISNSGTSASTATFSVTPTANGCPGSATNVVITVNPTPVATATPASQTICSVAATSFELSSTVTGTTFAWTVVQGAGISGASTSSGSTIAQTLSNSGTSAGTATYTVTPTANGCNGSTINVVATVNPLPSVTATPNTQTICSDESTGIALTSGVAGTSFSWTVSQSGVTGASASSGNTISQTLTNSGTSNGTATYTITPSANSCNGSTATVTVTVKPRPVATANPSPQTICSGGTTSIALTSNVTGTSFAWTVVQAGGITGGSASSGSSIAQTLSNSGISAANATYTVTPTANSCAGSTINVIATVNPLPSITATPASQSICSGETSGIALTSNVAGTTFCWTVSQSGVSGASASSGVNIAQTLTNSGTSNGTATYTITPSASSCSGSSVNVVVTVKPLPSLTATPSTQSICSGATTNVALTSNVSGSSFAWTVAQGAGITGASASSGNSIPQSLSNSTSSNGTATYTVTPTANGCNGSSGTVTITIKPTPSVSSNPVSQAICNGGTTGITLSSPVSGTTFAWTVSQTGTSGATAGSGTTISQTITLTGAAAGTATYTITPTASSCNGSALNVPVTVNPIPTITATTPAARCGTGTVILGATASAGTINWYAASSGGVSLGTGNSYTTPSISSTTTYYVDATNNGCTTASRTAIIATVDPVPTVDAGSPQTVCANNAVTSLIGLFTNSTGVQWSSDGSGLFGSLTEMNTTYTPSPDDITDGSIIITLSSTGNGSCPAATDQFILTISAAPTANAGENQTVCANAPEASLDGSVTVATGGIWSGYSGTFSTNNIDLNAVYTPSAAEIAAGTVTLTLTTTGNGNCIAVSDPMTITINTGIYVDANTDQTVCANNTTVTLNGDVSGYTTTGHWTSSGNGLFENANVLNTTYTPSVDDISAGTIQLTLASTNNGLCVEVSDPMTITITTAPTVDAGIPISICANNANANLNGTVTVATGGIWTGGNGLYTPNNATIDITYSPTAAEIATGTVTLTLTSTGNGTCLPVSDPVTITITTAPTITAGDDQHLCASAASVDISGIVTIGTGGNWTTNGTGTFGNENLLTTTYSPSAADKTNGVILTLTSTGSGNCTEVSDLLTLDFQAIPTVDAGAPQTVCANNSNISLNGTFTGAIGVEWSGGAGTYNPNNTAINAVYTPSLAEKTAGSVQLTLTTTGNANCAAVSDQVLMTITEGTSANAGPDQTVCANNAVISLNGNVTVASGGEWSANNGDGIFGSATSLNTTYTPGLNDKTNGSVKLYLTTTGNGTCLANVDSMVITITPAPTVNPGNDKTVCASNADILLTGLVTVATGGTWTGGAGTYNPDENTLITTYTPTPGEITAETVTLTLTTTGNGLCNAVSDPIVITITDALTVDAGEAMTVCAHDPIVSLSGTVPTSGEWTSSGLGDFLPNSTAMVATYTPTPADTVAGGVDITLTSTNNGLCAAAHETIHITINSGIYVQAGDNQTICENAVANISGHVIGATSGHWTSSGTGLFGNANILSTTYTPSAADKTAGSVTLTFTSTGNGDCEEVTDEMIITLQPLPTVDAGNPQTVCANNAEVTLAGTKTGATGVEWSTSGDGSIGDLTSLTSLYAPGVNDKSNHSVTLTITTTGNGFCPAATDNVVITITNPPVANAGGAQSACSNAPDISLNGVISVATGGIWSSSGNGTFSPDEFTLDAIYLSTPQDTTAGTITLTLTTTGNGTCLEEHDDILITYTPGIYVNAGTDQSVCANNALTTINGYVGGASVTSIWSRNGSGDFNNSNLLSTTYTPSNADTATGEVFLILTSTNNGTCAEVKDTLKLTITPPPVVNAGADQTVCSNSPVSLNGSVTHGSSSGNWTSTGVGSFDDELVLNTSYNLHANDITTGNIKLVLTSTSNGNCLAVTDTMNVSIQLLPVVDAGPDQTKCRNNDTIYLAGTVSGVTTTGQWSSNGTGSFMPNTTDLNASYFPSIADRNNGTVILTLSSTGISSCPTVSETMTVTITPAITVLAGSDQSKCSNNRNTTLNGIVSGGSISGTWSSTGSGSFNPDASTLNATYIPSDADTSAGSVVLTLDASFVGSCLAASDNLTLTITNAPFVEAGDNQTVCANKDTVTLNGIIYGGTTTGTWTSSGSGGFFLNNTTLNAQYRPSAADTANSTVTLTLSSTNNGGCIAVSDMMTITISNAPYVNAGVDQTLCANNNLTALSGIIYGATSFGAWTSTGNGGFDDNTDIATNYTPSANDISSGTVSLVLESTGNGDCYATRDTMKLTITPAPVVEAGDNQTICSNSTVTIEGSVTGGSLSGAWTSSGTGDFDNAALLHTVYNPSDADTTAHSVVLTLTATNYGNCLEVSDNFTLTIVPLPVVNAGEDQTVCRNNDVVTLNGYIYGSVNTGSWTSNGTGIFTPDANTLNATYTPSEADRDNGNITLTLISSAHASCEQVSDQMTINITPDVLVNAGDNRTVCANNSNVLLNGVISGGSTSGQWTTMGTGTGNFSPDEFTLNAMYIPSDEDTANGSVTITLLATSIGNCLPAQDVFVLTISDGPSVSAGVDQTVCANNADVNLSGLVSGGTIYGEWTTSGTGSFNPDATTLNAIYIPSVADTADGSVVLTLTSTENGGCVAGTNNMSITITNAPFVDAGNNQTVCINNPATTIFGIIYGGATEGLWSTAGSGSFTDATALNTIYTPSQADIDAGSVLLTLATTDHLTCNPVSDTMRIIMTDAPYVSTGGDQSICSNSIATLQGVVSGGSVSGQWSSSGTGLFDDEFSLSTTYTPSEDDTTNGSVTITLVSTNNGTCIEGSDVMTLTFDPLPVVNAGENQTVCRNNDIVTLAGSIYGITNTGEWISSGTGSFDPANTALNASFTPSEADRDAGSVTLTLNSTGNESCISVGASMTITITPAIQVSAGNNQNVCSNNPLTNISGLVSGGSTTGTWSSSGTGSFDSPSEFITTYLPSNEDTTAGFVTLTLTATDIGNCLPAEASIVLTITNSPIVFAGTDITACANIDSVQLSGVVSAGSTSGQWTSSGEGSFYPGNTDLNAQYIAASADTANGSVILTLVSTNNGTCTAVTDQVDITFTDAPFVDAGTNQVVCANNALVSLSGTIYGATSTGIWSSTGTGDFENDQELNTTYTPSTDDIASGSVKISLTATNIGTCKLVSDTIVVTITPPPLVNAGQDVFICSDQTISLHGSVSEGSITGEWATNGNGSFEFTTSTLINTYYPTTEDTASGSVMFILTSTNNGGCIAEDDTLFINFVPVPVVNAGTDLTVCAGNDTIHLAGIVTGSYPYGLWTSNGSGAFVPNDTTLNALYLPSDDDRLNGSVRLILISTHNPYCSVVADSILITINPPIVVNAGDNISVCSNNPLTELNGNVSGSSTTGVWSSSGTGNFNPDEFTLNAEYIPSDADTSAGNITLTLLSTNNGDCIPVSDQLTLTITNAPIVNAGTDQTVCANKDTVQLAGIVSGGATGGTWSTLGTGTFSPNTLSGKYRPSIADTTTGSVQLILTSTGNGICFAVKDTMTITITNAPFVEAGESVSICPETPTVTVSGIIYGGSTTGIWTSTGTGLFDDSNVLNTFYNVTSEDTAAHTLSLILTSTNNGLCYAVSDTLVVSISNSTAVNVGLDQTICAHIPTVSLSGNVIGATTSGAWTSSGNGTFSPDASTLNAVYNVTPEDTTAGSIYLVLTSAENGFCASADDTVFVTINPGIYVEAGPDQTVCGNNAQIQLIGNITAAGAGVWTSSGTGEFTPDNTSLNSVYTPSSADIASGGVTLYLTSTSNGDCEAVTDSMKIIVTPSPSVNAGPDLYTCNNNPTVHLSATISAGSTTGLWSTTGSGLFDPDNITLNTTYNPSQADIDDAHITFYLVSTNNGDCVAGYDTIEVYFTPAPIAFAGNDTNICASNPLQLNGSVQFGAGTGIWSVIGTPGSFSPNANTLNAIYTFSPDNLSAGFVELVLTASNLTGCNLEADTMLVSIFPGPIVDAGSDVTVCGNNNTVQLAGSVSGPTTTGDWSTSGTGIFLPSVSDFNAGYYPSASDTASGQVTLYLESTNNAGCVTISDSIVITFSTPPVVSAGQDQIVCKGNNAYLNGSMGGSATSVIWTSSGNGSFSLSDTLLNATYIPSAEDTLNTTLALYFTSTNNGNCLPAIDTLAIIFTPKPIVTAGTDLSVCANNSLVTLSGFISDGNTGEWTSSGTGSFAPTNTMMNVTYTPSAADKTAGFVNLVLSTTNTCLVTDTVHVIITPKPNVNAGLDQILCIDQSLVLLNGSVTGGATTGIWTTNGTGYFTPFDTDLTVVYHRSSQDSITGQILFTLTSTNYGNCLSVSDNIVITYTSVPIVDAGQDFTFCSNNADVALHGSVTGGASTGIWTSNGDGIFVPDASTLLASYIPGTNDFANGQVTLTLTSTEACVMIKDSVKYTFTPAPVAVAGEDQAVCANNGQTSISGVISGTTTTGQWYSSGNGIFTPSATSLNATYTPGSTDITAGYAELLLASTNNGMCYPATDTMLITITPAPVPNAGPDKYVCKGSNVLLTGSVTGGASTGEWATTGSGTFTPNNTTLNATYIPTASDTTIGTISFFLTTTDNGTCLSVNDNMVITFTTPPSVLAGDDVTICANNASVSLNGSVTGSTTSGLWTSSGGGTFSPNANTLTATYNPEFADISVGYVTLYLNSTNACQVQDSLVVTITNAPSVDVGNDQYFCITNPVINLNAQLLGAAQGEWSSTGTGVFTPSTTSLVATYLPSPADTLLGEIEISFVTTDNGDCLPASDVLNVFFIEYPIVDAGQDATYCGNTYVVLEGTITGGVDQGAWSTEGTGIFDPSPNLIYTTYNFSPADTASSTIDFVLASPDFNGCPAVTDSLTVTILPSPWAQASGNITVCANNNIVTLSGVVGGTTTSGQWVSMGSGTFLPDDTTMNVTYIPSFEDNMEGSVTIYLRSTNNGLCYYAQDTVTITITPAPNVNAGDDQYVCNGYNAPLEGSITGGATTGYWTTTGTGTFIPNNTTFDATYVPSANDTVVGTIQFILTATDFGDCLVEIDTMSMSFTAEPYVEAGDDLTVCANNAEVQLNGIISGSTTSGMWTTNGSGTFHPEATALDAVYVPSAQDKTNGSVTLTLQSTNACLIEDSLVVSITPAPEINAGPDRIVCYGNYSVLLTATITGGSSSGIWTSTGNGNFTPDPASLNVTYNVTEQDSASGLVYLILTSTDNGTCFAEADSVKITFSTIPVVTANPDIVACANTDLVLSGTVTGGNNTGVWISSGNGTFVPSDTSLNASYIFSFADTTAGHISIQFTATNACVASTDTVYVTITPAPFVTAWTDQQVCANNPEVQLHSQLMVATGLQWSSSGGGIFTPGITDQNPVYSLSQEDIENGSVALSITTTGNGDCNSESSTLLLNIISAPDVTAGSNQLLCFENVLIALDGFVAEGASTGIWTTTGNGTFVPNNTTFNSVYQPAPEDTVGGVMQFVLTSTNNGSCLAVSDTMFVVWTERPFVTIADSIIDICTGIEEVQLTGSVIGPSPTGIWTSSGTGIFTPDDTTQNAVYLPSEEDVSAGNVVLTLTSTGGCSVAMDSVVLNIHPLPQADFGFITACNSLTVDFNDSSTVSADTITIVNWSFSDGGTASGQNPSYTFAETDTFVVTQTVTTNYECASSASDTVVLFRVTADFAHAANCVYDSVTFTDYSTVINDSIVSWQWNFGDNATATSQDVNHLYSQSQVYVSYLIVSTARECSDTVTFDVTINPSPVANFVWDKENISSWENVQFTDSSSGSYYWTWDFDDGSDVVTEQNPIHMYNDLGVYNVMLIAMNNFSCVDTLVRELVADGILGPKLPGAFTPNGDGMNDWLIVRGGPFTEFSFKVYNEWGKQVFATENSTVGWDGKYKGKDQPIGVYVYVIHAVTPDGKVHDKFGDITIIR